MIYREGFPGNRPFRTLTSPLSTSTAVTPAVRSSKSPVIVPIPVGVTYSADSNTATVQFRVSQNATGSATLDPAHLVFKFSGVDAYRHAMDKSADEYSGFSNIV